MDEFDMDDGGGEDEGQIAIDALKEMRGVLRAAMSRMPSQAAASEEEEAPALDAIEEVTDEAPIEEEPIDDAPIAEKKTVLSVLTPKYGGGDEGPPPPVGKLKAKKKGF